MRQIDRKTNRTKDRQTDREKDRQTNRQTVATYPESGRVMVGPP